MGALDTNEALRQHCVWAYPQSWVRPEDAKMAMVLASGKCATTTLTHLLNLTGDMVAYHELPPRLWHLGDRVFRNECNALLWDEIYWASRRDVISNANEAGFTYVENNHRVSPFAPAVHRLMPETKFIVLWRDFDETVVSAVRWGWYGKYDRTGEGRIRPPPHIKDVRLACAWYWCAFYRWVFEFVSDKDAVFIPFSIIKERKILAIQRALGTVSQNVPRTTDIEFILDRQHNKGTISQEIPKNWQQYDEQAAEITQRLLNPGEVKAA